MPTAVTPRPRWHSGSLVLALLAALCAVLVPASPSVAATPGAPHLPRPSGSTEQQGSRRGPRVSFFEVHLDPANVNDGMFGALRDFVELADRYGVKLTLLFTPPWAEMILEDNTKVSLLNQWRQNGHEIGGHHHGPSVCPWDGYTNLDVNGNEFKARQDKVPCPKSVREQERYLGNMDDYMELINGLGTIHTITMSDEDVDWPAGALYAAGGRKLQEAISEPRLVTFNGHQVWKLSSATFLAKETVLGELITLEDLEHEYLSSKAGVFGINGKINSEDNIDLYRQWFEFLQEQDPGMKHAKTVSQILQGLADHGDVTVIPIGAVSANGKHGSVWRDRQMLQNPTDSILTGELCLTERGQSESTDDPCISYEVPAHGVLVINGLYELAKPGRQGAARVRLLPDVDQQKPVWRAQIFNQSPDGELGMSLRPDETLYQAGETLENVLSPAGYRDGLFVATGADGATIHWTYVDASTGAITEADQTYGPLATVQYTGGVRQLLGFDPAPGSYLMARIDSGSAMTYLSRNNNQTNDGAWDPFTRKLVGETP